MGVAGAGLDAASRLFVNIDLAGPQRFRQNESPSGSFWEPSSSSCPAREDAGRQGVVAGGGRFARRADSAGAHTVTPGYLLSASPPRSLGPSLVELSCLHCPLGGGTGQQWGATPSGASPSLLASLAPQGAAGSGSGGPAPPDPPLHGRDPANGSAQSPLEKYRLHRSGCPASPTSGRGASALARADSWTRRRVGVPAWGRQRQDRSAQRWPG